MNSDQLSNRLSTVASYIEKGMTIADIGSDHAYLPCYSLKKGIAASAIAGEVAEGPCQSAKKQVRLNGLEDKISVRKGDGLEVLAPGEADCVIIAGMGGALIRDILNRGKEKISGTKRLILQPNIGSDTVRRWLVSNNWGLIAEEILEEDDKIYEVLVAEKNGTDSSLSMGEAELLMGPFLLKEKNPVFKKKWQHEMEQWKNVLRQLEKAEDPEKTLAKRSEMEQKIRLVKEALA